MASRWILAFLVVLLAVAPSAAQQPLPLDPGKAWKHKHSGIIVPATLAGTPRDRGMTYAPDELDLGLSFVVGDAAESLTVYIFRNTNGAVPVWFSQAQWGIEHRGNFGAPRSCRCGRGVRSAGSEKRIGTEGDLHTGPRRLSKHGADAIPGRSVVCEDTCLVANAHAD